METTIIGAAAGHAYRSLINHGEKVNNIEALKNVFQVNSLSKLMSNIANIDKLIDLKYYDNSPDIEQAINKAKGDLFEVFTAMWLNIFGGDRHYSIMNLKWAPRDQKGYDFMATNHDGRAAYIQSKFRSNPSEPFESNQLETFLLEGNELDRAPVRYLFTNAMKVSGRYKVAEREGKMRIIDYSEMNKHANIGFWNTVNEATQLMFKE
jgi:hypothetical protein